MDTENQVLIVKPGKSFWLEVDSDNISCTLQFFDEGGFEGMLLYDRSGMVTKVEQASLTRKSVLQDKLLPWRRIPVRLECGHPRQCDVSEVVAWLTNILDNEEFEYDRGPAPDEVKRQLRFAVSPDDVFRIVSSVR